MWEGVSLELDGTTIYGSCIGFAGYGSVAQKGYINQDDKGVHITGNTDSGYGNAAFYIKLDNGIPDDLTRASAVSFLMFLLKGGSGADFDHTQAGQSYGQR